MPELLILELDEAVVAWARREALGRGITVPKLVEAILKQHSDEAYGNAYRQWRQLSPISGIDAGNRPSRDQIHERPRRS